MPLVCQPLYGNCLVLMVRVGGEHASTIASFVHVQNAKLNWVDNMQLLLLHLFMYKMLNRTNW